jgi:hypothetical protein
MFRMERHERDRGEQMTQQPMSSIERDQALAALEFAQRETPVCRFCGQPTAPVAHADGSVWLECPSATAPKPALRRFLSLDFVGGHTHRLVVGAPATSRAA